MADVTVTYDEVKRAGAISVDKGPQDHMLDLGGPQVEGDHLNVSCAYSHLNDGESVSGLMRGSCSRSVLWDDVPQNIKDALVAIDAYMQTAMNEDAGLV